MMTHRTTKAPLLIVPAWLAACAFALLIFVPGQGVLADDPQPRVTVNFQGEQLCDVAATLSAVPGVEVLLEPDVDPATPINATVMDFPLEQALTVILEPIGLTAVEQDEVWVVRNLPAPEPAPGTPATAPPAVLTTREPPAPTRAIGRYEPQRGVVAATVDGDEEERDEVMEVIFPNYLGAATGAMIFGGGIIDPSMGVGMGGGMGGVGGTTGRTGGFGGTTGRTGGFGGTTGGIGGTTGGFGGTTGGFGGTTGGFGGTTGGFGGTTGGIGGTTGTGTWR